MEIRAEDKLLLKVEEAGQLCGLPRNRAYELCARGEWPTIRLGRSLRVPRAALLTWIGRTSSAREAAH